MLRIALVLSMAVGATSLGACALLVGDPDGHRLFDADSGEPGDSTTAVQGDGTSPVDGPSGDTTATAQDAGSGGGQVDADAAPSDGSSVSADACTAGFSPCSGRCADLDSDPLNCGACGHACAATEVCNGAGVCECRSRTSRACGPDAGCLATAEDPLNCGACANALNPGHACSSGTDYNPACSGCFPCPGGTGQVQCSWTGSQARACVDTRSDPLNCGQCGTQCAANQLCVAGQCRRYTPAACSTCGDAQCCMGALSGASICCAAVGSQALQPVCIEGTTICP